MLHCLSVLMNNLLSFCVCHKNVSHGRGMLQVCLCSQYDLCFTVKKVKVKPDTIQAVIKIEAFLVIVQFGF